MRTTLGKLGTTLHIIALHFLIKKLYLCFPSSFFPLSVPFSFEEISMYSHNGFSNIKGILLLLSSPLFLFSPTSCSVVVEAAIM
jgi:hypothetical protein